MRVPSLERSLGIEVYATRPSGIGGVIRQDVEDFVVEEMLVDGSMAPTAGYESVVGKSALGSSQVHNRYLLCVLVKRNWDTFIAVSNISRQLGISSDQVQIAGIKDAKAVTAQYVTLEHVLVGDVEKVHVKDVKLYPVGYLRNPLSTYYLLGNHFHVTIRNIRHSKKLIGQRIRKITDELEAQTGLPNFFGHQRFGTTRPITHQVGRALVRGGLEQAAMLFLAKPSLHEHPNSRQARRELRETGNFRKALSYFPKQLRYERLMLRSLAEDMVDFASAFRKLPARLRRLFVEAYQSYLFNRFLSERIMRGVPLNVAEVGDYVVSVERSGLPMLDLWKTVSSENLHVINRAVKDGKMRIALPLVGYGQQTSRGVQGEIEQGILEEEDVELRNFRVDCMREMGSKGRLRAIVTPVQRLAFGKVQGGDDEDSGCRVEVDFVLYRGAYATVVLREIMKPRRLVAAGF